MLPLLAEQQALPTTHLPEASPLKHGSVVVLHLIARGVVVIMAKATGYR